MLAYVIPHYYISLPLPTFDSVSLTPLNNSREPMYGISYSDTTIKRWTEAEVPSARALMLSRCICLLRAKSLLVSTSSLVSHSSSLASIHGLVHLAELKVGLRQACLLVHYRLSVRS